MPDVTYLSALRGLKASLNSKEITNGALLVTTDSKEFYVDIDNARLHISDLVTGNTAAQIQAIPNANALPKIYIASDTRQLFWNNGEAWVVLSDSVSYATSAEQDASGNVITNTYETISNAESNYTEIDGRLDTLESTVSSLKSFEIQMVSELPVTGQSNIIYFVPDASGDDDNVYEEFIWVKKSSNPDVYAYEQIGTTRADLDNYYTKSEIDSTVGTLEAADQTNANGLTRVDALLGSGSMDPTAQGYQTFDARITANGTAITGINNELGTLDYTTDGTVASRLSTLETASTDHGTRLTTAEGNISTNTSAITTINGTLTTHAADIATNASDIDDLETDVASIHRYNIVQVEELPLAADADQYTIYMIPEEGLPGTGKDYSEWVYVPTAFTYTNEDEEVVTINAGWQRVDSTVDFLNYYTKTEVDALISTQGGNIAQVAADLATLTGVVNDNKQASDAAEEALQDNIDRIDAIIGDLDPEDQDYVDVATRLAAVETKAAANETAIGDSNSGIIKDIADINTAATALAGRVTTAESAISTAEGNITTLTTTTGDHETRITALETSASDASDALDRFDALLGSASMDPEAQGYETFDARISANASDISDLEDAIGTESTANSILYRIKTVETDLGTEATARAAADTAIGTRIDNLVTTIGSINRFDIQVVQTLPATGAKYVIYFVPVNPDPDATDNNTFTEYMWIETNDPNEGDGYYEELGLTEADLSNYYSKTEFNAIVGTLDPTAAGYQTIDTRITALENDSADADALAAEITARQNADNRFDALLGSGSMDPTAVGYQTFDARITANASDISDLEDAADRFDALLGSVAMDPTAQGYETFDARITANANDISDVVSDLADEVTARGNADDALSDRLDTLEAHDFLYAGSATEGGAATNVVETAASASDNTEHEVLFANANHDAVEYSNKATFNPSTGNLTVTTLTLGQATLSFDATTESVVFSFT